MPSGGAPTVALALARALQSAGVERIFGVPGEDHLVLLDAIDQVGLSYVPAVTESAACIMAAADAQLRGDVGVALVGIAPGLTAAINGIATAHLDGVPLLVISGQHGRERQPLIIRQGMDNHAIVHGVTKWSLSASTRIHQVLARAIDTALAPPSGPVYLELREEIATVLATDDADTWTRRYSEPSSLDDEQLLYIRMALTSARRPAILVGGFEHEPEEGAALGELAHNVRCPVFTTPMAKGLLPPDSPWNAGVFMNGNLEEELLREADVILAVNVSARDFFNRSWPYAADVIAIDDASNTEAFIPTRRAFVADGARTLDALSVSAVARGSAWRASEVAAYRERVKSSFSIDDSALTIPTALRAIAEILGADALLAVDAGFGKPITSYLWPSSVPRSYLSAHGLSTMGYAIPAANALKIARPDRAVVGLMGDGSLLMRASEISVAANHSVAPIFVAWCDASLSQIEIKQRRGGLREVGVRVAIESCRAIAEAFGARGADVHTLDDFRGALQAAKHADRPTLIGAWVDQSRRDAWFELLRG